MFGTLGFSELIIILAIILIIFGAGRLPQIGEGVGKALKGFKKEVHDIPPPQDQAAEAPATVAQATPPAASAPPPASAAEPADAPAAPAQTATPYRPGPEMTPGTTASVLVAGLGPQPYQPPKPKTPAPAPATAAGRVPTMDQQMTQPPPRPTGVYPPLPPGTQPKPAPKRPSAIVNKEAVARVQAQQAALRTKAAPSSGPSPQDMQSLGESLGDALRTFRQAAADVRNSIDPEMRTIQAEMDAAQKELEQSIEAAKQLPQVQDDPPRQS